MRSAEPVANGTAAADGGAPEAEAKDEGPTLFRGPGKLSAQEVEQLRAEEAKRAETDREVCWPSSGGGRGGVAHPV